MSMSSSSPNPLTPTFRGYIATTVDALVLFEACLSGQLNHVPRRPHDRERPDLITSGNVFIYEEHASGIKRWTDGVSWSPSRILGNFLIYRELDKPFPPGEKKRALKKGRKPQVTLNAVKVEPTTRQASNSEGISDPNDTSGNAERSLIGSLVDSYPFKTEGLVKKTISITYQGVPHHLVSYYSVADVTSGRLATPGKHANLHHILPRSELLMQQNFRMPIQEDEGGDGRLASYLASHGQPFLPPGTMMQRAISYPGYVVQGYPANIHYGFTQGPAMMHDHQHMQQQQQQQQHHQQQQQQQQQHQQHTQNHQANQSAPDYTINHASSAVAYTVANQAAYTTSPANYTPSGGEYGAHRAEYSVPRADYNAPRPDYNIPRTNYNIPRGDYSVPQAEYNVSRTDFNAPEAEIVTPQAEIIPPPPEYSTSQSSYSAPPERWDGCWEFYNRQNEDNA